MRLKILLILSFEKLPSFKVLACSVVEFLAIYWAGGGKHPPPPVLIWLSEKSYSNFVKSFTFTGWYFNAGKGITYMSLQSKTRAALMALQRRAV